MKLIGSFLGITSSEYLRQQSGVVGCFYFGRFLSTFSPFVKILLLSGHAFFLFLFFLFSFFPWCSGKRISFRFFCHFTVKVLNGFKSSHRRCSVKKVFLKFRDLQLFKKWTPIQVFPCKFCKILKNTYFEEHLRSNGLLQ